MMMQCMLRVAGDGQQHWHLVKRACETAFAHGEENDDGSLGIQYCRDRMEYAIVCM